MSKTVKPWTRKQLRFIEWLATDRHERIPSTQGALAKELKVAEATLSRWKKRPGFVERVNEMAMAHMHESLPQIFAAVSREAIRGSYQHAKLALELAGYLSQQDKANAISIIIERHGISTIPTHLARESTGGRPEA